MKRIALLFAALFLCCASRLMAQDSEVKGFIATDAITFYNCLSNPGTGATEKAAHAEQALAILKFYTGKMDLTRDQAKDTVDKNAFLHPVKTQFDALMTAGAGPPPGVPSAGGGFTTTLTAVNLADGLAKFLIERGKQEISTAFFERMRDEFKRYAELKYLLPNTWAIVKEMESHNILNLLQELRAALIKDLNNMPSNILSIRYEPDSECDGKGQVDCKGRLTHIKQQLDIQNANTDIRTEAMIRVISLIVMQGIISGDDIISIFDRISIDQEICKVSDGIIGYIKLTAMMMESLRSANSGEGLFIPQETFRNIVQNPELFGIFLGLSYSKYVREDCYKIAKVNNKNIKVLYLDLLAARTKFTGLISAADKVNASFKAVKNLKAVPHAYEDFASSSIGIATNFIKLMSIVIPYQEVEDGKNVAVANSMRFNRLMTNLQTSADLCVDVEQQNFAAIFVDLAKFVKTNSILKDNTTTETILKYLSFGANLASATSSDEIKEAINAIALPPGSYSVKRKSAFNVAINGYIGYNWDHKPGEKKAYAQGIYAPLGVSFSKGFGKCGLSAVTLFAGVFDVGAIASYRLMDNSTDQLKQDIKLESIVSPSAQLFVGIPKVPITAGIGWRRTPKLIYDTQTSFVAVNPINVWNINLLIDIPIINLFNAPYKN